MSLQVAIFGDSAMWGQGLLVENQFARLAMQELAGANDSVEVLPGRGSESERGFPRSGAKINETVRDGAALKILLPGGGLDSSPPGDRANFARTFRSLFSNDTQMRSFLSGPAGEGPAARLFGENPAAFPTVTGQLLLARGPHPDIDFVVVNGGINDVDFETVLDPNGPSPLDIARAIDRAFGRALADLLSEVRRQFPNAVVIVPGYFVALSPSSDREELKTLFEFLSEKPEWQIAFNDVVQALPLMKDVFEAIGLSKDVRRLVESAIRRTVAAAAYAHYRTRATIAALPISVRLPGMFYVHPAFRAEHALFAGERSLVYSGYRLPGQGRLSVADEMLSRRLNNIPRRGLLDDYRDLAERAARILASRVLGQDVATQENVLRSRLAAFRDAHPDLPSELLRFVQAVANFPDERLRLLLELLGAEIGRIEVASIASFIHPNPDGAKRYARRIVQTYRRHRRFSLRSEVGRLFPSGAPISLRKAFKRHRTELPTRATALAAVTHVESVALRISGLPTVHPLLAKLNRPATVTLGPNLQIPATFPVGVAVGEPHRTLFAFDTPRDVHLSEITELAITNGPSLDKVELHLNAHKYATWDRADGAVLGGAVRFEL